MADEPNRTRWSPNEPADPRNREIAKLHRQKARLETEPGRARKVIEVKGKLSAPFEQLATDSAAGEGGETGERG